MAARMDGGKGVKGIKVTPMSMPVYESPTTLRVNVKKHKGMDGSADVGKMVHFSGHGKVTHLHKDQSSHTMEIEVHHLSPGKP